MTSIRVELLTGRYTAGPHREWPPAPARLFFAAVAAWGEGGSNPAEREALLWWERLPPPVIVCSGLDAIMVREDVGHFVPINDVAVVRNLHGIGPRISEAAQRRDAAATEKERARAARDLAALENKARQDSFKGAQPRAGAATDLDIMPAGRPKQLRTYPTVRPDSAVIHYDWPAAEIPPDLQEPLAKLLARVGRLGHASTLVHCEVRSAVATDDSDALADDQDRLLAARGRLNPDADGDLILRVPAPELLDELEIEYEIHQGRAPRRLPSGAAAYQWLDRSTPPATPLTWERSDDHWLIMEIESIPAVERWQPGPQPALGVARTAELARALRGALLRHCVEPIPPVLSGHRGDRPNEDPHAMFLALPNAGSTYSDGSIGAAVLAIPGRTDIDDVAIIEDAVQQWFDAGDGSGQLWFGQAHLRVAQPRFDVGTQGIDARRFTTTRSYWARPSLTWTTVTPIALDRFPRALRGNGPIDYDAFDDQVAELVTAACRFRGLPVPRTIRAIAGSPMVGIPPVRGGRRGQRAAFLPYHTEGTGQVRFTTHLQLSFDQPVRGPLILGSGRHFGYGLFLPSDRRGGQ